MADVKISALPSATTPLAGTEQIPLVQGTATKQVTVDGLFTSANLGTPSAISLTNATNVPVNQAIGTLPVNHGGTGTTTPALVAGTNVTISGTWPNQTINSTAGTVTGVTATAPVVSSGGAAPVISMAAATASANGYLTSTDWNTFNSKYSTGGALGTPSSGTATNLTGLPLSTGVTGLLPVANGGTGTATPAIVAGTNVTVSGTWPNQTINASSSAQVYPGAGIANSTGTAWGTSYTTTGTGTVLALATSPTFVTPILGTPTSATLTNATGLPLTTGVTGTLPVANGETGAATLAANNVILGNGTSAVQVVAPSTNGNVLTSNGTTWASTAPTGITTGKSIAMAMIFGF
jgi:hypothetical protein